MKEYYKETWTPLTLEGFCDKYLISSHGRVWCTKNEAYIAQHLRGIPRYYYVNLRTVTGLPKGRRVHNVMMHSFVGTPEDKTLTVDHIDRDKCNNMLWNLRWADRYTQMNNRQCTIHIDVLGEQKPLTAYLRSVGFNEDDIGYVRSRVHSGEPYSDALLSLIDYRRVGAQVVKVPYLGMDVYLKDLCTLHCIDYTISIRNLSKGFSVSEVIRGFKDKPLDDILQTDLHYFPNYNTFENYHGVSKKRRSRQSGEGLSLQEILDYVHDCSEFYRFDMDGFHLTREEHCTRVGTSLRRAETLMLKHDMTFEDALKVKPKRIIKHTIDGEVKRNSDWFVHFGIPPIQGNGKIGRKKSKCYRSLRKTLEFFGVDTSDMTINPYI